MIGDAELAHQHRVEWGREGSGDLRRHGNTAARETDHDRSGRAETGQRVGQLLSGGSTIPEAHRAMFARRQSERVDGTDRQASRGVRDSGTDLRCAITHPVSSSRHATVATANPPTTALRRGSASA